MSQEADGTTFPAEWGYLPSLRRVVSGLMRDRVERGMKRVKIKYRSGWEESGYISRSSGRLKCPIVIHNRSSIGGGLMGHHVESISETRKPHKVLWSLERDEPAAWVHLT